MVEKEYDLIVIGAGTAGCLAAFAAAKKGLSKIALIDRKTKDQIGRKICGDGIGTKHIEFLEEKGFPLKEEGAINNLIKTAHIVSPDKKTDIKMPTQEKLTIINRHKFGQVLLKETINAGVELFDDEHKKLVQLIDDLHSALKSGKAHHILRNVLTDLENYTRNHFLDEERYMAKYNYPGYSIQKQAHGTFIKKLMEFKSQFEKSTIPPSLSVMNFLREWLTLHILQTDKQYASFFNERGVK